MLAAPSSPWAPHLHPDVFILVGGLAVLYARALRRLAPKPAGPLAEAPVRRQQVVSFGLGLAALLVATSWPVHDLAERYWYSAHMVQHLLLMLVAPPLLVAGIPDWLWRVVLRPRAVRAAFAQLTRPLPALVVFNAVLVASHWPVVVEATLRSGVLHLLTHAVLVGSAVVMWWPVTSPLPELPRLSYPGQMLYLFLQSLVPTVPASFLTFGSRPLYRIYETFPRLYGVSALSDMRVAGLIMKLVGGLILWGWIAYVFFRWFAEEQRPGGWDALQYRDVERHVRGQLTKTETGA